MSEKIITIDLARAQAVILDVTDDGLLELAKEVIDMLYNVTAGEHMVDRDDLLRLCGMIGYELRLRELALPDCAIVEYLVH